MILCPDENDDTDRQAADAQGVNDPGQIAPMVPPNVPPNNQGVSRRGRPRRSVRQRRNQVATQPNRQRTTRNSAGENLIHFNGHVIRNRNSDIYQIIDNSSENIGTRNAAIPHASNIESNPLNDHVSDRSHNSNNIVVSEQALEVPEQSMEVSTDNLHESQNQYSERAHIFVSDESHINRQNQQDYNPSEEINYIGLSEQMPEASVQAMQVVAIDDDQMNVPPEPINYSIQDVATVSEEFQAISQNQHVYNLFQERNHISLPEQIPGASEQAMPVITIDDDQINVPSEPINYSIQNMETESQEFLATSQNQHNNYNISQGRNHIASPEQIPGASVQSVQDIAIGNNQMNDDNFPEIATGKSF